MSQKSDALLKMIDEQIAAFDKRRKRDKDKAFWFRMIQAFASASTAVLLGLNLPELGLAGGSSSGWLKACALIISAAATVFAAWDAFFDHRELWVRYANAASALRAIRAELQYVTSSSVVSDAVVDELFHRFQEALEKVNMSWAQLRSSTVAVSSSAAAEP